MDKTEKQAAIYLHINKLQPSKDNPRSNNHAVRKIANSIKLHGFASPIIANLDYEILAGHTRIKAMKLLNKEYPGKYSMVPVRLMDITGNQAKLFRIADNKLGEIADWNETILNQQLKELLL